jgi:hypothetical protein
MQAIQLAHVSTKWFTFWPARSTTIIVCQFARPVAERFAMTVVLPNFG